MSNRPTVPSDLNNESVMRAWYQALQLAVQDLINDRLNVRDFGAYGDGIHDDTTAFGAAISAADSQNKTVWIPKGRYKIVSTLTLANPITIVGDGPDVSTILPFMGAAGGDVFLVTSSDVNLIDFGFDGTDTGTVTLTNNEYMVHVNPASGTLNRVVLKNLKFEEFDFKAGVKDLDTIADIRGAYCIKVEDTDRVIIEDCYAKNISGGFVYTTGVNFIDISRNYMEDVMLHPICLHDTTNYFNITENEFNPTDTEGVFLGGLIDVTSVTGAQCHHGNIENNRIKGIYNTSGFVSYGAVIRVLSSTDITIQNNYMTEIMDGSLNIDSDFIDQFNIKIGTYGTSSSDDNGPCKRIKILNNYINGSRDTNTYHFGGILVENDYQTDNLHPAEDIKIIGNTLASTATGISWLERGIVINGKSSGIKDVIIEDNSVTVAPETPSSGVVGRGAVSVISTDVTGKCYQIFIGGNRIENLKNDGAIATAACLTIGQYTSEAFCTKPNYLKGYSYGVVIETGAGSNLWYWDNNYYEEAGANTVKFVFNVQPKSYHTSAHGTTSNRPTADNGRTDYTTYYDTTLGTPVWYDGSNWVGAWGSVDTIAETISDQVGTMVTGNTETGITVTYQDSDNTLDFVVSDTTVAGDTGSVAITPGGTLTVAGGTNISTAVSGSTLTVSSTAATPAPVGASYLTLGTDATLTSERVLTAGTNITFTDGGAGSTLTIDATGGGGGAPTDATYVTLTTNGTLSDERVLTAGEGIDITDAGAGSTITIDGEDASDTNKGIAKFDSTDFTVTTGNVVVKDSGIDHNATTNYDANKHIDHTAVTLTAGEGITGGGTIAASRSFALDFSDLSTTTTSIAGTDLLSTHDGAQKKITWANAKGSIDTVGTVTTGTWSATNIALNKGGTNAALTASNGGIFYSTATAGGILSGTATAGQLLTSGASTTPAWTTSTYPLTNAVSTLLYASSANVMSALATANNGVLITGAGGVPAISSTIPNATQDNITRTGTITSGTWTGTTIAVANGGTGQTSYTNGQLLIGNTTGNTLAKANLTAGVGIGITNGASSISIDAQQCIQRSWIGV